jgi:hypothetical protein
MRHNLDMQTRQLARQIRNLPVEEQKLKLAEFRNSVITNPIYSPQNAVTPEEAEAKYKIVNESFQNLELMYINSIAQAEEAGKKLREYNFNVFRDKQGMLEYYKNNGNTEAANSIARIWSGRFLEAKGNRDITDEQAWLGRDYFTPDLSKSGTGNGSGLGVKLGDWTLAPDEYIKGVLSPNNEHSDAVWKQYYLDVNEEAYNAACRAQGIEPTHESFLGYVNGLLTTYQTELWKSLQDKDNEQYSGVFDSINLIIAEDIAQDYKDMGRSVPTSAAKKTVDDKRYESEKKHIC